MSNVNTGAAAAISGEGQMDVAVQYDSPELVIQLVAPHCCLILRILCCQVSALRGQDIDCKPVELFLIPDKLSPELPQQKGSPEE